MQRLYALQGRSSEGSNSVYGPGINFRDRVAGYRQNFFNTEAYAP